MKNEQNVRVKIGNNGIYKFILDHFIITRFNDCKIEIMQNAYSEWANTYHTMNKVLSELVSINKDIIISDNMYVNLTNEIVFNNDILAIFSNYNNEENCLFFRNLYNNDTYISFKYNKMLTIKCNAINIYFLVNICMINFIYSKLFNTTDNILNILDVFDSVL